MKYIKLTSLVCVIATQIGLAQKKIELSEIWDGTFKTEAMQAVNTLNTTNQYARIERIAKQHQVINL